MRRQITRNRTDEPGTYQWVKPGTQPTGHGLSRVRSLDYISITVEDLVALWGDLKRFLILILGKYVVDFQILGQKPCESTGSLSLLSCTQGLSRYPLHGSEWNLIKVMTAKLFFLDGLQKLLDVQN